MMNTKDILINELVMRLADKTNISVGELKTELEIGMNYYSVEDISTTEIGTTDGTRTNKLLSYFIVGKYSSNTSDGSIQRYSETVKQICEYTGKELDMISADEIKMFLVMKQRHGIWTANTADQKRLYLSSVYGYLHKHGMIKENPMLQVDPIKHEVKIKKALSQRDIERIIIACENEKPILKRRDMALISFMLSSGCRVSEVVNINLEDVNFQERTIIIRKTKNKKERIVTFSESCAVRIEDYLKDREEIIQDGTSISYPTNCPLFASVKVGHKRMTKNGMLSRIKTLSKDINTNTTCHTMRRTFATTLARKHVSPEVISKALGHGSLSTLSRYDVRSSNEIAMIIKSSY